MCQGRFIFRRKNPFAIEVGIFFIIMCVFKRWCFKINKLNKQYLYKHGYKTCRIRKDLLQVCTRIPGNDDINVTASNRVPLGTLIYFSLSLYIHIIYKYIRCQWLTAICCLQNLRKNSIFGKIIVRAGCFMASHTQVYK